VTEGLQKEVIIQSRVASRYEWRTAAKAKRCPGLGARPVRCYVNHKALGSSWRGEARASRPPFRRIGVFFESRVIPAGASGANRPNPQATIKVVQGHPRLNGYKKTLCGRCGCAAGPSFFEVENSAETML